MTHNFPEWAYLIDESGRYWYHLENGTREPASSLNGAKKPQRAVYAIPTHDIVSHPHWVSSKDEDLINQVVAVENEKLGVKATSGPGRISDWKPVEINGSRTLVQSVSIPWEFEVATKGPTEFTDFIPQYSLFAPPENSVVLWKEDKGWVAGYSRANRWAHVQPLGNIPPAAISGEIELTLMELSAKGIIDRVQSVVVWAPEDPELRASLESPGGIPVHFLPHPPPSAAAAPHWAFEPHEVSLARRQKQARRRVLIGVLLGIFVSLLLAAAAVFHLRWLDSENARLASKIAANAPEAEAIRESTNRWYAVSPAVEPELNPLELFHRVASLLPDEGFRFTSFKFNDFRTITVKGQGSTMTNALDIKGALERSPELRNFEWNVGKPVPRNDLFEFTATGVYQKAYLFNPQLATQ